MNDDPVFKSFLETSMEGAQNLTRESDRVSILPFPPFPSSRYLVMFECDSLAGHPASDLRNPERISAEIHFPPHYLRELRTEEVVTLISPGDLWHSNVRAPFVCVGDMAPGTPLVDIVTQLFEIFTYQNVNLTEGFNREAAEWARSRVDQFPIDSRPLRRPRTEALQEQGGVEA